MAVIAPTTADRVLEVAISQLGISEDPPYSNKTPYTRWYGLTGPWCAMFVSWCLHQAGFPIHITTAKGYAYCPYGVDFFKRNGAWIPKTERPHRGDVVFFDFPGDGVNRPSHTGLVEGTLSDGRVSCIEGNTNGAGSRTGGNVMRHYRSVKGGIIGYGRIEYAGSTAPQEEDEELAYVVECNPGRAEWPEIIGHVFKTNLLDKFIHVDTVGHGARVATLSGNPKTQESPNFLYELISDAGAWDYLESELGIKRPTKTSHPNLSSAAG